MRIRSGLILASLLLVVIFTAPLVRAEDGDTRGEDDHGGGLKLQSGNLTAIFEGQKPSLRFFFNSDPRQAYFVKFNSLIEHNDTDHNLVFEHNETLAMASLEAANWTHTNFTDTGDHVEISFTTHQLLIQPAGRHTEDTESGRLANVDVTFIAKLYKTNVVKTITVGNATFTIHGGVEIKVDILIAHWPFISMNNRLALRIDLHSQLNEFRLQEHDGEHEVHNDETDTHENETTHTHETEHTNGVEHEINDHEDGGEGKIQFLTNNSTIGGFFRFVNNSITDGKPTPVGASFRFESDEDSQTQNEFKLFISYHSFSNTLVHDPSFGITPRGAQTPFISLVPLAVVSIALSAAAVALARRKKSLA